MTRFAQSCMQQYSDKLRAGGRFFVFGKHTERFMNVIVAFTKF